MTTPSGVIAEMLQEELDELILAIKNSDEHGIVDALADMNVLINNEIALMRYDIDLVMKQVVKHISSRVQDPTQKDHWFRSKPDGKWLKWKDQDPDTLIEPDYTTCKVKKL